MSKGIFFHATFLTLLVSAVVISLVSCDGDQQQVVTKDSFSFTLPNPMGEKPLFETNEQEGGRYFGLHIPVVYDGVLHFKGPGLFGTKMSMDWFHGLFSFIYDKRPQGDGRLHGPVRMEMFWITVYNNGE